jgi:hypothetical protein
MHFVCWLFGYIACLSRQVAKFVVVVVDRVLDSTPLLAALSLLPVCKHFTRPDYIRTLGTAVVAAGSSGSKYIQCYHGQQALYVRTIRLYHQLSTR